MSGMWNDKSRNPASSSGFLRSLADASVYLCGCNTGGTLLLEQVYLSKNGTAWIYESTIWNHALRNGGILHLPYATLFSGKSTDELLLQ